MYIILKLNIQKKLWKSLFTEINNVRKKYDMEKYFNIKI